jgi:predicted nucleic acid-binding protein
MKSKIIFDSNVWIGFLNINDTCYKRASRIFEDVDLTTVCITEYILLEILTVLKQKTSYKKSNEFIELINKFNIEVITSQYFFKETLEIFEEFKENKLSFVDISLLYLSHKYEIITFDRELQKYIDKIK